MSQCLYLEILRQCWGRGSKFDYSSSRLGVYIWRFTSLLGQGSKFDYYSSRLSVSIWRFCISVGAGKASFTILLDVSLSVFGDFVSVLGHGKQV